MNKLIVSALILAGLLLIACDHVRDPWVGSESHLAQERNRAPAQQQELRERTHYQLDR